MPGQTHSTRTLKPTVIDLPVLARALREILSLRHQPVALSFVHQQRDELDVFSAAVPSACTFWRRAEHTTFFAPAEAHYRCPIGVLTMGFSMPNVHHEHLMDLIGKMSEVNYLQAEEAANIPSVPGNKSGIVYGPLETFPVEPDVVLIWVSTTAAMLLTEATKGTAWTPAGSGTPTFGRPSCAAIAVAMKQQAPTLSLGCTGMRIFTEIDADLELAVLPQPALADLSQQLNATAQANKHMAEYYTAQRNRT